MSRKTRNVAMANSAPRSRPRDAEPAGVYTAMCATPGGRVHAARACSAPPRRCPRGLLAGRPRSRIGTRKCAQAGDAAQTIELRSGQPLTDDMGSGKVARHADHPCQSRPDAGALHGSDIGMPLRVYRKRTGADLARRRDRLVLPRGWRLRRVGLHPGRRIGA